MSVLPKGLTMGKKDSRVSKSAKSVGDAGELQLEGEIPPQLAPFWAETFQGEYQFRGVAGRGKTGIAYRITRRQTNADFCLKMVKPDLGDPNAVEAVRESLTKEIQILLPLTHRCLPAVLAYDIEGSLPYYVCTFHPGKTFDDFAKDGQRLGVNESFFAISSLIVSSTICTSEGAPIATCIQRT